MPAFTAGVKSLEKLLRQPHTTRVDYFDADRKGLCLRLGPREATWYFLRRINGKLTRLKLGTDAELCIIAKQRGQASFTIAREKAGEVESQLAAGIHPKAEQARQKDAKRAAIEADEGRIIRNVAAAWMDSHLPDLAPTTQSDYRRMVGAFVDEFGDADIGTLPRREIKRHLDTIKKRSGSVANRAAVVVRMVFAYAVDLFDLEVNPAREIRKPATIKPRKRTLSRDEVRVLWRACELAGYPYGHALRFALCTGQRIGEVGSIRRHDIDREGFWTQTENKSDRRIDIHIASHAVAILDDCPNFGPASYFFSASGGERGVRNDSWRKAIDRHIKPRIKLAAAELELGEITLTWAPHDLRRTVRTGLTGWTTASPDTAERVLNHAISGLRGVYDHADYKPHVQDALRLWDAEIARVIAGEESTREANRKAQQG